MGRGEHGDMAERTGMVRAVLCLQSRADEQKGQAETDVTLASLPWSTCCPCCAELGSSAPHGAPGKGEEQGGEGVACVQEGYEASSEAAMTVGYRTKLQGGQKRNLVTEEGYTSIQT